MPKRRRRARKSKYVTKRGLPFQLMKYNETKYKDIGGSNIVLNTIAPIIQHNELTLLTQGNSIDQRIGNVAQASGVYTRIVFEAQLTGQMQFVRCVLSTPRITSETGLPISDMVTPIDPDIWKVWYDKTLPCPFVPGGGGGVLTIRKKFKPYMKLIWDSVLGSDITQGKIFFTILPKNALGVQATWNTRLYFKDM